jgi:DNA-binding response OmpR family regulator
MERRSLVSEKSRGKILICDDSKDLRSFLILKFIKAGFEVLEAEDGKEAIRILQEQNDVDILILDIMMPNMNGFQTLHQLKIRLEKVQSKEERERTEKGAEVKKKTVTPLKIIFYSANSDEGKIDLALQNGGDDYIIKPVDFGILLQKIERLLDKSKSQQFVRVPASLDIKIKEYPSDQYFKLVMLSEVSAHLEIPFKIPDGELITVISGTLVEKYKLGLKLKGSVIYTEEKVKGIYETEIIFKGLSDDDRKLIRVLTVKSSELKETVDEEEEV